MAEKKVEETTKELELFDHSTGELKKVTVQVVNYINGDNVNTHIKKEELSKLAFKFKVPEPQLYSQEIIDDIAYYQKGKPFDKIKEPFNKVKRFLIVYVTTIKTEHGELKYFGEGSAAADNIGAWPLKSYAYEIAHKRAKVRCLKNALGTDILSDVEMGSGDIDSLIEEAMSNISNYEIEEIENEEETDVEEDKTPSTEMQRQSLFDIIARRLDKDHKKNDCVLSVLEIKDYLKKVDQKLYTRFVEVHLDVSDTTFISKKDSIEFFSFVTSEEAANFFISNGNLSNTVKGKENKAIEKIQP